MQFKTPKFDKNLEEYFSKLKLDEKGGQTRKCRFSGIDFYVRPEDVAFYKKMAVPLPTLSPKERIRRKGAYYPFGHLSKVKSALTGNLIISHYPSNTPYKVYEHQTFFGEKWEPLSFGQSFDPRQKFFELFKTLQLVVPRPNLIVLANNTNSDFCDFVAHCKNCYLVFDGYQSEDSAYTEGLSRSRNCYDCLFTSDSDTCYDAFQSYYLYKCFFCEYSKNCLDSYFLFDCKNCEHCFGCVNLRHKKYHFLNEPLTKEAYEEKLRSINLGNRLTLEEYRKKYEELKKKAIYRENHNEKVVNSIGDYLVETKNCYACFYSSKSENLAYSLGGDKSRDSYDLTGGLGLEQSYECASVIGFNLKFSYQCMQSNDLEYCDLCNNCKFCFGSIGLKNKSFCLFNRQYSEEEYWRIVDEIKTAMLKSEEYGEFFPPNLMPVPFNISVANSYKGYDDLELAKKYGYRVEEIPETITEATGEIIETEDVPNDISDVSDDILKKIIFDRKNNKKFFYTKDELGFHRRHNLPLPLDHFSARLAEKRKRFGTIALELFERTCDHCGKKIKSPYPPEDKRTVYCVECYNQEIV